MWYFAQALIIGSIVVSNEYLHWTPNKYLAGMLGVAAAFIITKLLGWLVQPRG
jgi:hypothetical protein